MVDFLQCCFNPIAGVNVGRVHFRRAYALRFRHKKQLVRVSKTARFDLKYLFWSPRTRLQMSWGLVKNTRSCLHRHQLETSWCLVTNTCLRHRKTLPEMEPSVCFLSPQKRLENGGLLKNIQWCGTYTCWHVDLSHSDSTTSDSQVML